jgi:glyoxylase-like metal-dependent hydrolase (beta-lactamase superfamily II)
MRWRWAALAATAVVLAAGLLAVFTPDIYAELLLANGRHGLPGAPPPEPPGAFDARPGAPAGAVAAGHWRVQQIAPDTWALGEPQDAPDNYEYLLVGARRALLIDAGSTTQDIRPVLAGLTTLPVTVLPTHLHWDHTTGLKNFSAIALIDLPQTRALERGGQVRLTRYAYLHDDPPSFRVSEWVEPGGEIDLGGRKVQLLSTPGHTTTSASIWDPGAKLLFTGDLIYPTTLYVFAPDSSLSDYAATADRLLAALPADTRIYGAHCCRNDGPPQAPWLSMSDLRDVRTAVANIRSGKAQGRGLVIRRFPVNARMTLLTLYPFGNW